jgi:hypothetical protein
MMDADGGEERAVRPPPAILAGTIDRRRSAVSMEMFVVRIWRPGESEPSDGALHGFLLHVPTRREVAFRSADELVAELRDCLSDAIGTEGRFSGAAA